MHVCMAYVGELSAIASAALWVITGLAFASAGRRVGATIVNTTRIWLAFAFLLILHLYLHGHVMPSMSGEAWFWLAISGVLGLAIGDQCLYRSLIDAGPRTTTLVMAVVPGITAVIAWPVLGQSIGIWGIAGMVVTLSGVMWVVSDQPQSSGRVYPYPRRGVVLALLAAICQSVGLVTSKLGMGEMGTDTAVGPWTATYVRVAIAAPAATLILLAYLRAKKDRTSHEGSLRSASVLIVIGALCGPFLGVGAALVAINYIDAGIAATLIATSPIMILPFARLIEREHLGSRAIWGAVIAIIGVGMLVLPLP
jgi:drug/metabolite transporter (DMT)-like permease